MAKLSGYIGAYTEGTGKSTGIYYFSMDADTGVIEDIRPAVESKNPAYLAFSPSKQFLYAVNEVGTYEDTPYGAVSAYAVQEDGTLKLLNRVSSGGAGPCHISIHRDGGFAVVANYGGGVLAVLPIGKRGSLGNPAQIISYKGSGPNEKRQEQAHAHSFTFAPDFSNGFACDLGSDKIMLYRFDPKAKQPLVPWEEPFATALPGYGPRHGVFHPSGRYAYVLNELASAVDVFGYTGGAYADKVLPGAAKSGKTRSAALQSGAAKSGKVQSGAGKGNAPSGKAGKGADSVPSFARLQTISTLPKRGGGGASIAAAVRIRPDGKFLYASNRGHDSIAVFKVLSGGLLEAADLVPSGGKHPRDFTLDPQGNFLLALNKDSDSLVIFKVNHRTGLLKKEREYPALSPTAIVFK
jgi:6-phosphogluconolactonase